MYFGNIDDTHYFIYDNFKYETLKLMKNIPYTHIHNNYVLNISIIR